MTAIVITNPNQLPRGRELYMLSEEDFAHTNIQGQPYVMTHASDGSKTYWIDPQEVEEE